MNAVELRAIDAKHHPAFKEERVGPMWSADENERRMTIALRAAAGARKAWKTAQQVQAQAHHGS